MLKTNVVINVRKTLPSDKILYFAYVRIKITQNTPEKILVYIKINLNMENIDKNRNEKLYDVNITINTSDVLINNKIQDVKRKNTKK